MGDDEASLDVAGAYDLWSEGYDSYDNAMVYMADFAFRRYLSRRQPASVFEFGCGTGRNLALCDAFGVSDIAGTDFSAGMLAKARQRPGAAGWHLEQADLHDHTFQRRQGFDLVLFGLVLEHVGALGEAFAKAKRLLAEKGEILVLEIHPAFFRSWTSGHFVRNGEEVRIPGFDHSVSGYIEAADALDLDVADRTDWTPSMAEGPLPHKVFKRGLRQPLLVQLSFRRKAP